MSFDAERPQVSRDDDNHLLGDLDHHCSDADRHLERQRGGLTQGDKQFLCKSKEERAEMDDVARRNTRYRIRQRIEHTLLDLVFVEQRLSNKDVALIFESLADDEYPDVSTEIFHLFYRGIKTAQPDLDVEEFLEEALATAKEREQGIDDEDNIHLDVTIDADISRIEIKPSELEL